jgi:predicted phosphohydrolase
LLGELGNSAAAMKLGWLSDVHLNFLGASARLRFFEDLSQHKVDGWLLSGDIGEAESVVNYLREFEDLLPVRIYFVLGNHDFYHGSIAQVKADVRLLSSRSEQLVWLTDTECVEVDNRVGIVGDDGWSDGRLGNAIGTPVELNDFYLIKELTGHARSGLVQRLNKLGDEAAERLGKKLNDAASRYASLVVVTHPPPFEGATWYQGTTSWPDWLPWFSCAAVGEAIMDSARAYPETDFLVLCGHTHSAGRYTASSNVTVHTAQAEYGQPAAQGVIELGDDAKLRVTYQ